MFLLWLEPTEVNTEKVVDPLQGFRGGSETCYPQEGDPANPEL